MQLAALKPRLSAPGHSYRKPFSLWRRAASLQNLVDLTFCLPAPRHSLQLSWDLSTVNHVQGLAAAAVAANPDGVDSWAVTGHTTPNLADIGGSSIRLRKMTGEPLYHGGYLLGLRKRSMASCKQWLPAVAGVPGDRGPDDHGKFRPGLAECMIMVRPIVDTNRQPQPGACPQVTFVHDQALGQLFSVDDVVEVVVLARLTDFFLGLNSGQWLKIRLSEIVLGAQDYIATRESKGQNLPTTTTKSVLRGTGFQLLDVIEQPPHDSRYKFDIGTSFVQTTAEPWQQLCSARRGG